MALDRQCRSLMRSTLPTTGHCCESESANVSVGEACLCASASKRDSLFTRVNLNESTTLPLLYKPSFSFSFVRVASSNSNPVSGDTLFGFIFGQRDFHILVVGDNGFSLPKRQSIRAEYRSRCGVICASPKKAVFNFFRATDFQWLRHIGLLIACFMCFSLIAFIHV